MRWLITSVFITFGIAVGAAQTLAPAVAASHLTVATSVAPHRARDGRLVSLNVNVAPKPKIHVYAPGAQDYEPIKVTIPPQAGITVRTLHYPKSSLLVTDFEKVPVYNEPFRLVQDVTIDPAAEKAGAVTIKGTVTYQACDDEVCFKPESIPVSWEVRLAR